MRADVDSDRRGDLMGRKENVRQSADRVESVIQPTKCEGGCFELDYADDGDFLVCRECGSREPYKRKKVHPDYVPSDLW